ncbi:hypothetical protein lbkm_2357 [Lachnospiraceae bacterium KM106-2]|nr:hypothetical protein lbkm_2357 [Lachnospiraceae bacterium KM106-2]
MREMKNQNKSNQYRNDSKNDTVSNSSKYDNVEPLPESSRPRRDGPGGEDNS